MALPELITAALKRPSPPALFDIGQNARPVNTVLEDGQTPGFWPRATSIVVSRGCGSIMKRWCYQLQHPNGRQDQFYEDELDWRFVKRANMQARIDFKTITS